MGAARRILASVLALLVAGSLVVVSPVAAAAPAGGTVSVKVTTDLGAPARQIHLQLAVRAGNTWTPYYNLTPAAGGVFSETGVRPGTYGVVLYDEHLVYGDRDGTVVASVAVSAGRTTTTALRLKAPFVERRAAGAVDTGRRSAVQALYDTVEPLLQKQAVSAARPASCSAGGTSAQTRSETLRVLNAARSLTGVDAASWSSAYNIRAERAAMLMAANKKLSHFPASNWRCFDSVGADAAAKSALASGVNGAASVFAYLADPGSGNTGVGHRRLLLNPRVTTMGSGNSDAVSGGTSTNAIYTNGEPDTSVSLPRYTSWPSAGYFPAELEPAGRWSVSVNRPDVTFEAAKITVTALSGPQQGRTLAVTRHAIAPNMGLNSVSFQVRGIVAPAGAGEVHYGVTVTGLRQRGATITDRVQYTVRLFNG